MGFVGINYSYCVILAGFTHFLNWDWSCQHGIKLLLRKIYSLSKLNFQEKNKLLWKNHTINYKFIHLYIPSKNDESDLFHYKIESNLGTTRAVTPEVVVRGFQSHSLQIFKLWKSPMLGWPLFFGTQIPGISRYFPGVIFIFPDALFSSKQD